MAFLNGVNTVVSIIVGIAGIIGFAFTVIDRRRRSQSMSSSAATEVAADPAEATSGYASEPDNAQRRRSGIRRLLLSPLVFLASFLGAGLAAALVDDPADEVDLAAIAGWIIALSVTLAWVYFAVKASRTAKPEQ